jgi:hypothetical protein
MSIRSDLADLIRPLLPESWVVLPYRPSDGNTGKPAVWLTQTTVAQRPTLARGINQTTVTATLVEPSRDPASCDDRLEANLDLLLDVLDRLEGVTWSTAERGVTDPDAGWPGYDIPLTLTSTRKAP